jgi:hypothetical protein
MKLRYIVIRGLVPRIYVDRYFQPLDVNLDGIDAWRRMTGLNFHDGSIRLILYVIIKIKIQSTMMAYLTRIGGPRLQEVMSMRAIRIPGGRRAAIIVFAGAILLGLGACHPYHGGYAGYRGGPSYGHGGHGYSYGKGYDRGYRYRGHRSRGHRSRGGGYGHHGH